MPDVILPVLDERDGAPVGARPHARRATRRSSSTTARPTGRATLAARLGAPRRARAAARASAPRAAPGCRAARADVVCFMDCDASLDPARAAARRGPRGGRARRPRARRARRRRPARGRCTRAPPTRVLAAELRRRAGGPAARPRPDARRPARRAARRSGSRDRRFGWPLEMVLRAAAAGWRIDEVDGALPPARRPLEGDRDGPRHAARRARHGRGAGVTPALLVIAKAPVAGRVKTRLCPPCTPEQAAALARAALEDTLAACDAAAAASGARRVLVLDGAPGDWLPAGWDVVAQRGAGLAERLAAALRRRRRPGAPRRHGHAAGRARSCCAAGWPRSSIADAVLGPAPDGGYWAIGLRTPDARVFAGVPMSRRNTGAIQRARLAALRLDTFAAAGAARRRRHRRRARGRGQRAGRPLRRGARRRSTSRRSPRDASPPPRRLEPAELLYGRLLASVAAGDEPGDARVRIARRPRAGAAAHALARAGRRGGPRRARPRRAARCSTSAAVPGATSPRSPPPASTGSASTSPPSPSGSRAPAAPTRSCAPSSPTCRAPAPGGRRCCSTATSGSAAPRRRCSPAPARSSRPAGSCSSETGPPGTPTRAPARTARGARLA